MLVLIHRIVISAPVARSVAIAALSATTMLASPLTAARDTTDTAVTIVLAQTSPQLAAAEATDTFVETFDQRITSPSFASGWFQPKSTVNRADGLGFTLGAHDTPNLPVYACDPSEVGRLGDGTYCAKPLTLAGESYCERHRKICNAPKRRSPPLGPQIAAGASSTPRFP